MNYSSQFIRTTSNDKPTIFGNADKSLKDLVYRLHDGKLPNNWIFDKVASLFDDLENLDQSIDQDDRLFEICDSNTDIYYNDMLEFLTSGFAHDFSDEMSGFSGNLFDRIAQYQHQVLSGYAQEILDFINNNKE
jgi:hypothetical protein